LLGFAPSPLQLHDHALVAAIARMHRFAVATRNGSKFAGAGIKLVDPWAQGPDVGMNARRKFKSDVGC